MKKLITVGVLMLGLTLTGCGISGEASDGSIIPLKGYELVLQDGRTVVCVSLHANAVSCDWDGAK